MVAITRSASLLPLLISMSSNQPTLAQSNAGQDTLFQHRVYRLAANAEASGDLFD